MWIIVRVFLTEFGRLPSFPSVQSWTKWRDTDSFPRSTIVSIPICHARDWAFETGINPVFTLLILPKLYNSSHSSAAQGYKYQTLHHACGTLSLILKELTNYIGMISAADKHFNHYTIVTLCHINLEDRKWNPRRGDTFVFLC